MAYIVATFISLPDHSDDNPGDGRFNTFYGPFSEYGEATDFAKDNFAVFWVITLTPVPGA